MGKRILVHPGEPNVIPLFCEIRLFLDVIRVDVTAEERAEWANVTGSEDGRRGHGTWAASGSWKEQ
jgi:hypothetical protein